jgi:hypothetical protein
MDSEHYRLLDTTRLISSLKKEHKQLIKSQSAMTNRLNEKNISISLLRRIIESWEHTRQRRFPRQTVNTKVNVTIGLHHAHMQLMYEQHLKNNQNNKNAYSGFQQPQFETIEIKSVEHEHSDVWSTVYAWANSIDPQPAVNSAQAHTDTMPESIVDYRVQQDNWLLVNESAEGLGLVCTETPASRVQVGEVISIQRNNSSERSIGLVRWMKARGESGIEVGVMLLAPNASPVGLIAEDPAQGDYVIGRGLLLPLMQILNRPESLLIFSRQYQAGDIIAINRPGKDNTWIRLVKLIADNGSVSQYLFTRINHNDRPMQQDGETTNNDQFSDIWLNI